MHYICDKNKQITDACLPGIFFEYTISVFFLSSQNSRYFNFSFSPVILRMISIILLYGVFNYFCSSQKYKDFPLFYYIKILITFFIKHFPLSQSFFSPILLVDIRASFQILHPPSLDQISTFSDCSPPPLPPLINFFAVSPPPPTNLGLLVDFKALFGFQF